PATTPLPPASTSRAPAGPSSAAAATRRITPSSTSTATPSRTGPPVPSNSRSPVSHSRPAPGEGAAISAGNRCGTLAPPAARPHTGAPHTQSLVPPRPESCHPQPPTTNAGPRRPQSPAHRPAHQPPAAYCRSERAPAGAGHLALSPQCGPLPRWEASGVITIGHEPVGHLTCQIRLPSARHDEPPWVVTDDARNGVICVLLSALACPGRPGLCGCPLENSWRGV